MIKLRIIIGSLQRGGAETYLARTLPKLVNYGYQIKVMTLEPRQIDDWSDYLESQGILVVSPPSSSQYFCKLRILGDFFSFVKMTKHLFIEFIRDRESITHFYLPAAYYAGMVMSFLTFAPMPKIMSRRSLNNYQGKKYRLFEKLLHKRLNYAIGNSQKVNAQLSEEGIPDSKLRLIYNGIDNKNYNISKPRDAIRESLGISKQAFVIIIVANLIYYKGHEDLLTALSYIKDDMPHDWHLLCVGHDSNLLQPLKKLSEEKGLATTVQWLGSRKDVPDLLNSADMAVLCSHEEGFSNAILEYMLAKLPIVATDVGGNSEAILHKQSGLIVPPREPNFLANAILEIANHPELAQQLGNAAYERVNQNFSLSSSVNAIDKLYKSIKGFNYSSLQSYE